MADRLKMPDTPISIAFRLIEPTWRNYIFYVGCSVNSIMPEQLCDLSGVMSADLISAVSREVWLHKHPESVITSSMLHPKMVQATAFYGQTLADCDRDRELFFRITGSLPDKKGTSIVINNAPQTANIHQSPAGANGFKPMDQRVIEMGKLLDQPDELEAVPIFLKETAHVLAQDRPAED